MHKESCDSLCHQAMVSLVGKNHMRKKLYTNWRLQKPIEQKFYFWNFILEWPNNINKAHITLENPVYLRAQPWQCKKLLAFLFLARFNHLVLN